MLSPSESSSLAGSDSITIPASFVASFSVHLVTIIVYLAAFCSFTDSPIIIAVVTLALAFHNSFFFFCAAYIEMDGEANKNIEIGSINEWIVRVINQGILFVLPFSLSKEINAYLISNVYPIIFGSTFLQNSIKELLLFACLLFILTLLYIYWDYISRKNEGEHPPLIKYDIIACMISILFLIFVIAAGPSLGVSTSFYLAIICVCYIAHALWAIKAKRTFWDKLKNFRLG